MADETNTPKETIDEKIARLKKEAELAQLEKESAKRNAPSLASRTKEKITSGVEKTKATLKKEHLRLLKQQVLVQNLRLARLLVA